MKVLPLHAHGASHLHDEPEPARAVGKIKAIDVCGLDFCWFSQGEMKIVSSQNNMFEVNASNHGR